MLEVSYSVTLSMNLSKQCTVQQVFKIFVIFKIEQSYNFLKVYDFNCLGMWTIPELNKYLLFFFYEKLNTFFYLQIYCFVEENKPLNQLPPISRLLKFSFDP